MSSALEYINSKGKNLIDNVINYNNSIRGESEVVRLEHMDPVEQHRLKLKYM